VIGSKALTGRQTRFRVEESWIELSLLEPLLRPSLFCRSAESNQKGSPCAHFSSEASIGQAEISIYPCQPLNRTVKSVSLLGQSLSA
jgi:hypothetical protein